MGMYPIVNKIVHELKPTSEILHQGLWLWVYNCHLITRLGFVTPPNDEASMFPSPVKM